MQKHVSRPVAACVENVSEPSYGCEHGAEFKRRRRSKCASTRAWLAMQPRFRKTMLCKSFESHTELTFPLNFFTFYSFNFYASFFSCDFYIVSVIYQLSWYPPLLNSYIRNYFRSSIVTAVTCLLLQTFIIIS